MCKHYRWWSAAFLFHSRTVQAGEAASCEGGAAYPARLAMRGVGRPLDTRGARPTARAPTYMLSPYGSLEDFFYGPACRSVGSPHGSLMKFLMGKLQALSCKSFVCSELLLRCLLFDWGFCCREPKRAPYPAMARCWVSLVPAARLSVALRPG